MFGFSSKLRAELSIIPILFSVGVYSFVSDQVYIWANDRLDLINVYSASIALGAILTGLLSDAFCRRRMLLIVHCLAALFLTIYYFHQDSLLWIALFGLFYNPLAIVRANLIDNVTSYSKIKLISFSFIVQFFPESLYFLYLSAPRSTTFSIALGSLLLSLGLGLFFFFDRRDAQIRKENVFSKIALFLPNASKKAIFTFIAFIPAQIAYFISDNLLEVFDLSPIYYSLLAFGALIGACMSTLYKKTPHAAVLTISYGLCLAIGMLPVAALFLYQYERLDIPFMFVALGSLLGFYVPFVYDVILHSVEKHYRGTSCGILDFVYSGSSLVTLILFKALLMNVEFSLVFIVLAFMLAVGFQKVAEKNF